MNLTRAIEQEVIPSDVANMLMNIWDEINANTNVITTTNTSYDLSGLNNKWVDAVVNLDGVETHDGRRFYYYYHKSIDTLIWRIHKWQA